MVAVTLQLHSGDKAAYEAQIQEHAALQTWLASSGSSYGLPSSLDELDDVGRETVDAVYSASALRPLLFAPPASLALPSLRIELSTSLGLKKSVDNFLALTLDPPKFKSKRSPHKPLTYTSDIGARVFRIEEGFVAQMGDVTRGDGTGGESIYGGPFNDEKEGLKTAFALGTVGWANSGKNSNTSQFFLTLTSTPAKLTKLTGKYVAFGAIDPAVPAHKECLERLSALADGKGGSKKPVWIGKIAVIQGS